METVLPQDQIRMEEPMSRHTTFGIGGPAECFITVDTPGQLAKIFVYLQRTGWDFFLLGNGSNLLVGDKGYRGVVIRLGEGFSRIRVQGERLTAGAGAPLGSAAKEALSAGLTGLEFASGIPGTVGGAVRMNADSVFLLRQKPEGIASYAAGDARTAKLLSGLTTHAGLWSEVYVKVGDQAGVVGRLMLDRFSMTAYSTKAEVFDAVQKARKAGLTIEKAIAEVSRMALES